MRKLALLYRQRDLLPYRPFATKETTYTSSAEQLWASFKQSDFI